MAAAGAVKLLGKVKPIGQVLQKIGNLKTSDNVLIRNRDAIWAALKEKGLGPGNPAFEQAVKDNRMKHSDIPNQKIGNTYDEEWERLHQMVIDTFVNAGRMDLAENFANTVPVFTTKQHDWSYLATLLKGGGSPEATAARAQNYGELQPLAPIMKEALQSKGVYPPASMDQLTQVFYNNFVAKPGTDYEAQNFEEIDPSTMSHVDESVIDAVVSFLVSVQQRKNQGEILPPVYDRIATGMNQVRGTMEMKAKEQVSQEIGGVFMKPMTWVIIVAIVVVAFLLIRKGK